MRMTRIDFLLTNVKANAEVDLKPDCIVRKWADGWFPGQPSDIQESKVSFDLDEALSWCSAHGWAVHKWSQGARAWLGEVRPVRTAEGIRARRKSLEREAHGFTGRESNIPDYTKWGICGHNLAFDW